MKKAHVATASLALLFVSTVVTPFVFAEDSTTSARQPRIEARQEIKELREDNRAFIASKEAEFKTNLQKIKDTRKQTVVSNISDRIGNRNTLWVSHWNIVTKRLSTILDKIQSRSDEAATKGKDVTGVTSAIASARTAIANAQSAIDAQSSKAYTVTINTENTLGADVRSTISTFQADVKSVITLLDAARKAVAGAFSAMRAIGGVDQTPTTQP